jgi:hypothetical protein
MKRLPLGFIAAAPIVGASLLVSNGDDDDLCGLFRIDKRERESSQHCSPEPATDRLAELWMFTN